VRGKCGVIEVYVAPGKTVDEIIRAVFAAMVNWQLRSDPTPSAIRVLLFYKLFFRHSPIVVIRATEVKAPDVPAAIPGAVRVLATKFGVRVIVDASDNSIPVTMRSTLREFVFYIEPMGQEVIMSIPELRSFNEAIKAAGLEELVWAVLGGIPASYFTLMKKWTNCKDLGFVPGYLIQEFNKAQLRVCEFRNTYPSQGHILDLFQHQDEVSVEVLQGKANLPSPCKVLRVINKIDGMVIVPADAATALVLRHHENKPIKSIEAVRILCKRVPNT